MIIVTVLLLSDLIGNNPSAEYFGASGVVGNREAGITVGLAQRPLKKL